MSSQDTRVLPHGSAPTSPSMSADENADATTDVPVAVTLQTIAAMLRDIHSKMRPMRFEQMTRDHNKVAFVVGDPFEPIVMTGDDKVAYRRENPFALHTTEDLQNAPIDVIKAELDYLNVKHSPDDSPEHLRLLIRLVMGIPLPITATTTLYW